MVYIFLFYIADIELGLKRDAMGAVDGSSLEALLKGEPLERRSGTTDLRGPEEDLATVEPPASSVTTSSGRIRKVSLKVIRVHYVLFLVQCTLHTADEWAQLIFYPIVLSPQSMKRMHHRQTELLNLKH